VRASEVTQYSTAMPYIWVVALLLVGLVLGAMPRVRAHAIRFRLKRQSTSTVARLRPNSITKVTGSVIVMERCLEAPLNGAKCVCYSLTIDDIGTENGPRVANDSDSVEFFLEDESGRIAVRPLHIEIVSGKNSTDERKVVHAQSTPEPLLRYLERCADNGKHQGILAALRRGIGAYRVRQTAVPPGASVTLRGLVSSRHDGSSTVDVILTCPDDGPLLVCCDN
jgi:hypothetical protein